MGYLKRSATLPSEALESVDLPAGRQVAWFGRSIILGEAHFGQNPQAKRDGAKRLGKATVRRRQGGHEAVEL